MNSIIELPPGATFSPADIVDWVLPMLDPVAHHRADDEHRYSASDIYWLIRDMLRRMNKDIDGEFYMKRLKKGTWSLEYRRKSADEFKADTRHQHQVDETKKLIERIKF